MTSPCCGAPLRCEPYDFGRCAETGYADAGEILICTGCGAAVDEGDVVVAEEEMAHADA